jgi:iron complex outermembrane receptor protein
MLNLTLEYNLPYAENKNLSLYLKGLNLTDEEARVHSSFIKDLAPLAGQSVLVGVRGYF